jgi:hypothetical protein
VAGSCEYGDEPSGSYATELLIIPPTESCSVHALDGSMEIVIDILRSEARQVLQKPFCFPTLSLQPLKMETACFFPKRRHRPANTHVSKTQDVYNNMIFLSCFPSFLQTASSIRLNVSSFQLFPVHCKQAYWCVIYISHK